MVFLVFDVCGGLCNQFYDILCGINFAVKNDIPFTFRYCTSRSKDMKRGRELTIDKLYDIECFRRFPLFKDFHTIESNLTPETTFNLQKRTSINIINKTKDIYKQVLLFNKEYVILPFFHTVYDFTKITIPLLHRIRPAEPLMRKYAEVKTKLGLVDGNYNYIHYRYEADFINHFQIKNMLSLPDIIKRVKFKDSKCSTYIACSNAQTLLKDNLDDTQILYKTEEDLCELDYEECAFVDFMIGKHSKEVYGNRRSSFSGVLNSLHQTNNFYC
jgi:hypothetical protein